MSFLSAFPQHTPTLVPPVKDGTLSITLFCFVFIPLLLCEGSVSPIKIALGAVPFDFIGDQDPAYREKEGREKVPYMVVRGGTLLHFQTSFFPPRRGRFWGRQRLAK